MNTRAPRGVRRDPVAGRKGSSKDEVFRITSAADSLREDQARRTKRYLIQMGIRMACLIGAVFTDGALMWVLLAGAIVLPYVAVVGANAGREKRDYGAPLMDYRELPGPTTTPPTAPPERNP